MFIPLKVIYGCIVHNSTDPLKKIETKLKEQSKDLKLDQLTCPNLIDCRKIYQTVIEMLTEDQVKTLRIAVTPIAEHSAIQQRLVLTLQGKTVLDDDILNSVNKTIEEYFHCLK